jgi:hypothetical protein
MATLFPACAMRVNRVALPLSVLLNVLKVSLYSHIASATCPHPTLPLPVLPPSAARVLERQSSV